MDVRQQQELVKLQAQFAVSQARVQAQAQAQAGKGRNAASYSSQQPTSVGNYPGTLFMGYGSQGGRRGVTPASTRLRPKAMCDSGRVRGTTMCVSTPLCEKQ